MTPITEGDLLWEPTPEIKEQSNMAVYMRWLADERGYSFDDNDYHQLWTWSAKHVGDFWDSIWEYFDIIASQPPNTALAESSMPGAVWFPGARLNYAENLFRQQTSDRPAILYKSETEPLTEMSWATLHQQTAAVANFLRQNGVQPGDRVVAYLPHIPHTIVAFLACASVGAIWSSCSPDFGAQSVLDRFQQIEPKILFTIDGYQWNGKTYPRLDVVADLQANLPTIEKTVRIPLLGIEEQADRLTPTLDWAAILTDYATDDLPYAQLPFDHPLWVLYSSGTTGLPKPIVQSQGGILLEHLKMMSLHLNFKPDDRFFWFTSTGWMMWNFLIGGLLVGTPIIVYNGSPAYPDMNGLWQLAAESGMTYFGTAAAYVAACIKAGITPGQDYDLSHIRAVGSTGSPLSLAGFGWIYDNVNPDLDLQSVSGGTDVCTAFIGGSPLLPVYAGELQCRCLGANVQAFDDEGQPVINQVGELVITQPMPSMPLYFWNDAANVRYRESYFEMFPGIWRHGDWIKINERGGCVIYGRSDSTINRQGVRMGTSEIYQAVESLPEIKDSLIVDLELLGKKSYMPLFLVLQPGVSLNADLRKRLTAKIRANISPRHVPDQIFVVSEIPRTLSGKKMEIPIRKILLGFDPDKAANRGAMANPESIEFFIELVERLNSDDTATTE